MPEIIDYSTPRRTIYGVNSIEKLKEELSGINKNILLVSYKNAEKSMTFFPKIMDLVDSTGNNVFTFTEIEGEPTIQDVDIAAEFAKNNNVEILIAIGGGSVIDLTKAVSILLTNPGSIRDYQMSLRKIENKGVDVIAIPTTAGTGAEVTKVSVITNNEEKIKKSILHPYLVPYLSILDPELIKDLPPGITALTGIDALSHAIEAYVSTLEIPFAKANAIKAIELIGKNLVESYKNPDNLNARMGMLIASYMAGLSLIASVGAAHRLAQPISSVTGLLHSEAISIILINVMKVNREFCREKFREIALALGIGVYKNSLEEASKMAISQVQKIYRDLDIKPNFSNYKIVSSVFPEIIGNAQKTTSHLIYNPRPLNEEILMKILEMSI
jgi:alcohol dehydrogenase class IV